MGQKSLTQKNLSQIEPNQKKPEDILAFPKKAQVQKKPISKKAYGQKEPLFKKTYVQNEPEVKQSLYQ